MDYDLGSSRIFREVAPNSGTLAVTSVFGIRALQDEWREHIGDVFETVVYDNKKRLVLTTSMLREHIVEKCEEPFQSND